MQRMRDLSLVAAASILVFSSVVRAQERTVVGEIGLGATLPRGIASDAVDAGVNFQLGVLFKPSDVFGIKLDTMLSRHDVKDDLLDSFDVGDGNALLWHVSGNAVLSTPMSARTSVYGIGGAGIYYRRVELTEPGIGLIEVCDPWLLICFPQAVPAERIVGERSSTDFGANVGGGINFRFGVNASLFAEARYHYVWGPEPAAVPLTVESRNGDNEFIAFVVGFRF